MSVFGFILYTCTAKSFLACLTDFVIRIRDFVRNILFVGGHLVYATVVRVWPYISKFGNFLISSSCTVQKQSLFQSSVCSDFKVRASSKQNTQGRPCCTFMSQYDP